MRTFYSSYPWVPGCFSSDDLSTCIAALAKVILYGMELYIPSTVVPIGSKSQPWFDTSCKRAVFNKCKAYEIWAEALVTKVKATKRKYNWTSRYFKWQIAKAIISPKSARSLRATCPEHISFGHSQRRRLVTLARLRFCHYAQEMTSWSIRRKRKPISLVASNSTLDCLGTTPPTIPRCQGSMLEVNFSQKTVRQALSSLNIQNSSGPDGISPLVLHSSTPDLVHRC